MATRQYDFVVGVETSTAPTPATPTDSSDIVSKGYTDATYAKLSSFYDKSADNAAVKAIASADRSNGQVTLNMGNDAFYRFNSSSTASDDADSVLAPDSGTGRWLKISGGSTGSSDAITLQLDQHVSTFLAAEAISVGSAVCAEIHNGTGSNLYTLFKCDADLNQRRSFVGLAKSAVSVTAEVKTYTISAAYVSGNVVPIVINGRPYSVTYASSSDATLQALATLIATDQDVKTATVTVVGGNQTGTDDRVITITGSNGLNGGTGAVSLNITGTTVTSGASQPTVTIATQTAASRTAIDVVCKGVVDGLSGLSIGNLYYLSGTAGAITDSPTGTGIYVGRALSTTSLFVDPEGTLTQRFGGLDVMLRSGGSSNPASSTAATTDTEHYNFTSWSSGTALTSARYAMGRGEASLGGQLYAISGRDVTNAGTTTTYSYNKSSWTSASASTDQASHAVGTLGTTIIQARGKNNGGANLDTNNGFNGSSWSSLGTSANNAHSPAGFVAGSVFSAIGGYQAGVHNYHHTYNGSSWSTATAYPESSEPSVGGRVTASIGICGGNHSNSTTSYTWNGSSWSSSFTMTTSVSNSGGDDIRTGTGGCAYSSSMSSLFVNGGANSGGTALNTTQKFNGSSWSAGTSSSSSRAVHTAGTV